MVEKSIYRTGDRVKYYDGRIGKIVGIEDICIRSKLSTLKALVVQFPDNSTVEGMTDSFTVVRGSI